MALQSQMVLYLRLINLRTAKQICQAKTAMLHVLISHGIQPILLHVYLKRLDYKIQ